MQILANWPIKHSPVPGVHPQIVGGTARRDVSRKNSERIKILLYRCDHMAFFSRSDFNLESFTPTWDFQLILQFNVLYKYREINLSDLFYTPSWSFAKTIPEIVNTPHSSGEDQSQNALHSPGRKKTWYLKTYLKTRTYKKVDTKVYIYQKSFLVICK